MANLSYFFVMSETPSKNNDLNDSDEISEQNTITDPHFSSGTALDTEGESVNLQDQGLKPDEISTLYQQEKIQEEKGDPPKTGYRWKKKKKGVRKKRNRPFSFLGTIFGAKEIDRRVEKDVPSWAQFSDELNNQAEEAKKEAAHTRLQVFISSPLQWNFQYLLLVAGALGIGYNEPEWASVLIYGSIGLMFSIALFVIFRDGVFFHMESQRLEADAEMINRHSEGPQVSPAPSEPKGFWRFFRKSPKPTKDVFLSKLLQIHYQNILRTFEQGRRRTWVSQDPSINDIHTLLSQRGMKLVWTLIEVLPQMGLLGTLIGLTRMFVAFSLSDTPQVSIIAGFGTALGTTILANLFVLILRPLYMRNERSVYEILNTLQILMATFILPTQGFVLNKTKSSNSGADFLGGDFGFSDGDSGNNKSPSESFLSASKGGGLSAAMSNHAIARLSQSIEDLSKRIEGTNGGNGNGNGNTPKVEQDLLQLRLLNRDILVLMEQISNKMGGGMPGKIISRDPQTRATVFPEQIEKNKKG